MPLKDFLTITSIQVSRQVVTPDGMGGSTTTTSLTTLPKAALWSPGQSARYISDKMARTSTHVLVTDPTDYTFTIQDIEVIYGGNTYKINGPSDNVMEKNEIMVTGLERIA